MILKNLKIDKMTHVQLSEYIKVLELENMAMRRLASEKGFIDLVNDHIKICGSEESTFNYVDCWHRRLLLRDSPYSSFKSYVEAKKLTNPLQSLEREFLLSWFRQCGFDTWTSFKAIVLHHYPEVTEKKLLEFWKNTAIDTNVLIRVNHVKQILG
jgi:hypothetical protein